MAYSSIIFKNADSFKDYGLTISERLIGYPSKVDKRVKIPNSNMFYDFSSVFGEEYSERTLEYTFNIIDSKTGNTIDYTKRTQELVDRVSNILNWLIPGQQTALYDSTVKDYYFKATVFEAPDLEQVFNDGLLTVKFMAYPFMISNKYETQKWLWDPFNFETDTTQIGSYTLKSGETITVVLVNFNPTTSQPVVSVSDSVKITFAGQTIELKAGIYENSRLYLTPGTNKLLVTGTGTIEFMWRREVI